MSIASVLGIAAGAAALGGLSYLNYRRFMPAAKSLNYRNYRVHTEVLPVSYEGKTIYGELLTPEDVSGPLPTVICCHGYGSSYKLCENMIGKPQAMSGYAAYCFDFCGGSKRSKSSGSFHDMTIFTEREDLLKVIDTIKTLPQTDKNHLYLLGESQGGMVSAITAPQRKDDIRALALYYPAFCIPFDAREKFPSKDVVPDEVKAFTLNIGGDYYRSVYDFDVYGEIGDYTGPVLILHGDQDKMVPHKYGKMGAEAYKNCEFYTLPGEIHGWTGKGKREAAARAYAFFENNQ